MGWKDRFLRSRQLVDRSKDIHKARVKQIKDDRKATKNLLSERKKAVRGLIPRVEKVLKQYNRAVKGGITKLKPKDWALGNGGWILLMQYGGVKAEIWPWVQDKDKPRILRGLWLQYLGPKGQTFVAEGKTTGTKLGRSYELGTEAASRKGYYHWIESDMAIRPHYVYGYFIPLDEFNEVLLATILEDIGYDLPRFKNYFLK